MKDKVEKLLIKRGCNPDDAKSIVNKNFNAAVKCYPDAKASFIADIVVM